MKMENSECSGCHPYTVATKPFPGSFALAALEETCFLELLDPESKISFSIGTQHVLDFAT